MFIVTPLSFAHNIYLLPNVLHEVVINPSQLRYTDGQRHIVSIDVPVLRGDTFGQL